MTQSRKDALQELLEHVEAGTASGKFGSMSAYWCADMQVDAMRAYSGSLDAAHDMHEVVLPGWAPIMVKSLTTNGWHAAVRFPHHDGFETWSCDDKSPNCPARAWLIAIIKALIAEADASTAAETIAASSATHADALRRLGDE